MSDRHRSDPLVAPASAFLHDEVLARATAQIANVRHAPTIETFFDTDSSTLSYVVSDPVTGAAAIIDSVADFDVSACRIHHAAAARIAAYVDHAGLHVDWLLETHVHADHLSAAPYLQDRCGGRIGAGVGIDTVRSSFASLFGDAASDTAGFDHLFADGETFFLGETPCMVLAVPGHTAADIAFLIGDVLFVGDTLFMPDYGTARADFPGGNARTLFRSIRRLLALPSGTRMFLCHDYTAPGRDRLSCETTVGAQAAQNIHLRGDIDENGFVAMRRARDADLPVPRLLYPAIQVNLRGGRLPPAEANGVRYLKLPLDLG